MAVELIQPGSGKKLIVADDSADFWRARGYKDAPRERPKKSAPKKK